LRLIAEGANPKSEIRNSETPIILRGLTDFEPDTPRAAY